MQSRTWGYRIYLAVVRFNNILSKSGKEEMKNLINNYQSYNLSKVDRQKMFASRNTSIGVFQVLPAGGKGVGVRG